MKKGKKPKQDSKEKDFGIISAVIVINCDCIDDWV